jgi:phosphoribosylaminoimidazole-succinocarboxamide synthase
MLTKRQLLEAIPTALQTIDLVGYGPKQSGKVRELYQRAATLVLITSDRISAFDRVLGLIPFKGQVLNQLSAWWFEQTRDIVANHLISVPDPNVSIVRIAKPLPVEVVVRGYITGVTSTSLWTMYAKGERKPYGIMLPDGLHKNDPLPTPLITPTTKAGAGAHDEQITAAALVERGLVSRDLWAQVEAAALALFARGQAVAQRAGLMLVDTKYEFGLLDGQLLVIDEIHTPDSSRFWSAASVGGAQEPENFDKEYLRKWYATQGYRGDGDPPPLTAEVIVEVARRYLSTYEQLTGQPFVPGEQPAAARIPRALGDEERMKAEG